MVTMNNENKVGKKSVQRTEGIEKQPARIRTAKKKSFHMVGIGASAGGLDALKEVFFISASGLRCWICAGTAPGSEPTKVPWWNY